MVIWSYLRHIFHFSYLRHIFPLQQFESWGLPYSYAVVIAELRYITEMEANSYYNNTGCNLPDTLSLSLSLSLLN